MIHLLFDGRPWFRAKNYGVGAGLPIAWQGWLLIGSHIALIAGLAKLLQHVPPLQFVAVLVAAFAPLPIYAAKTEGGWHWRWGKKGERK
jgi:hypothetical protein